MDEGAFPSNSRRSSTGRKHSLAPKTGPSRPASVEHGLFFNAYMFSNLYSLRGEKGKEKEKQKATPEDEAFQWCKSFDTGYCVNCRALGRGCVK